VSLALLKNTAWGALGEVAVRGAKIAQVILIARLLGAEDLGRYSYGVALAGLFSVLFDFGILPMAVKTLSQQPESSALRLFGRLKLITSLLGLGMLGVAAIFSKVSAADAWIAFGLGVYLALNDLATFVVATYRARGEFWRETLYRGTTALLQLVLCLATLMLTRRLEAVVVVLIAASVLGMVPLLRECARQPAIHGAQAGWSGSRWALLECLPLAGSILAGSVYMNFDTVVLANHVSLEEVGWYGVAVKAIFGLMIVPLHYLLSATFPSFASAIVDANELSAARARWLRGFVLSSTAGALLSLLTALLSYPLLLLLFGANFVAATPVLVAFTLIGFMFYVYSPLSQWLLLQGRQKITLYIHGLATIVNVVTVPLCIGQWGLWGAVYAAFATHLTIALGHAVAVFRGPEFAGHRSDQWALCRLVLATVIAIVLLHLQTGGPALSKLLAVIAFLIVAHREAFTLVGHLNKLHHRLAPRT
jgi:O-antigen/teichoic acid export membrane protein